MMSLPPSSLVAVYIRLGWTHLFTRPGRTLLTILGVGLGVAATIAVQTANVDVLRSFEESVLTVAGPVTLEVSAGEAGVDERLITGVRDVAGVESARPVLEIGVRLAIGAGRYQSFRILGVDLLDELNSVRGRLPASFDALQGSGEEQGLEGLLASDGILVGQGLALEIDAKPKTVLALEVGGRDISRFRDLGHAPPLGSPIRMGPLGGYGYCRRAADVRPNRAFGSHRCCHAIIIFG